MTVTLSPEDYDKIIKALRAARKVADWGIESENEELIEDLYELHRALVACGLENES